MSEDKIIRCWSDLPEQTQKQALTNDEFFNTLKLTYPTANFDERDRIKASQELHLECKYCGYQAPIIDGTESPDKICPQCRRPSLRIVGPYYQDGSFNAPLFVKTLEKEYKFLAVGNSLYFYDKSTGTWQKNAENVIRAEAAKRLKSLFKERYMNDVSGFLRGDVQANVEFNKPLPVVNLKNGKFDFATRSLEEQTPEDYLTYCIPHKYKEVPGKETKLGKIFEFLWDLAKPNAHKFITLIEGLGLALLPGVPIEKSFVLLGKGSNGKSTYLNLVTYLVGSDNTSNLSLQQIASRDFLVAYLNGKLINVYADLSSIHIEDVSVLKSLLGRDRITADRKHQDPITFWPTTKPFFSANKMPTVAERTMAFFRRWLFVELTNVFENNPTLVDDLTDEETMEALLWFLLRFITPYLLKNKDFSFPQAPDEVERTYDLNSNTADLFISDCLVQETSAWISKQEAYTTYTQWCSTNSLIAETQQSFFRAVKRAPFPIGESARSGVRGFLGVSIKEDALEPMAAKEEQEPNKEVENYKEKISITLGLDESEKSTISTIFSLCKVYFDNYKKEYTIGENPEYPALSASDSNNILATATENPAEPSKILVNPVNPVQDSEPVSENLDAGSITSPLGQGSSLSSPAPGPDPKLQARQKVLNAVKHSAGLGISFWKDESETEPNPELQDDLADLFTDDIRKILTELERVGDVFSPRQGIWHTVHAENGD